MRVAAIPAPTWPTIPLAITALLFPLALLTLWSVSARFGWLPPQILPSPGEVWAALLDMARSGDLARNAGISLLRVVEGFAAGSCLGLLLGIAMGLSPKTSPGHSQGRFRSGHAEHARRNPSGADDV
jgi:sulfonate transport system permease protein